VGHAENAAAAAAMFRFAESRLAYETRRAWTSRCSHLCGELCPAPSLRCHALELTPPPTWKGAYTVAVQI